MDIVSLALPVLALAGWLAWLRHAVARDGLGDGRPPASHEPWDDRRGGWPSAPLRTPR
ncbi:hypothetical protein [Cellulomonas shaoxiangyii]|uniref:hypothetical protein n=1 Tax=Cellulomonas shaoxiangyii TaxID=2566013 RepID=UPI00140D203C|nr:hypothetical protein [Cellulomonas shaoxiangyii]